LPRTTFTFAPASAHALISERIYLLFLGSSGCFDGFSTQIRRETRDPRTDSAIPQSSSNIPREEPVARNSPSRKPQLPRWSDRRLGSATKRVNFKLRPCIAPDSGGDHRSTHNTHVYDQKPVCHAAVFALGPRFPRSGDRLLYRAGLTSFLFSEFSERDPRSPRPGFVRRCPPLMPRA
jgi:hypothetical protein